MSKQDEKKKGSKQEPDSKDYFGFGSMKSDGFFAASGGNIPTSTSSSSNNSSSSSSSNKTPSYQEFLRKEDGRPFDQHATSQPSNNISSNQKQAPPPPYSTNTKSEKR